MNAPGLLEHFDRISDAPDAIPKLRKFILALAVRGKLVEQCLKDGTADALLESAPEEASPLKPPFDIPETWSWVSIGRIFEYDAGEKVEPLNVPRDSWLLDLEDIERDSGRVVHRATAGERGSSSTKAAFLAGDVLYGKLRPYLNKVIVADQPGFCTTEIVVVRAQIDIVPAYVSLALRRPDFVDYVTQLGRGTKMPRLRRPDAIKSPFPLPPLAEQRRIAAKVDELNGLCDRLAVARAEREEKRDAFVATSIARLENRVGSESSLGFVNSSAVQARHLGQLRSAITDLAVSGHLLPQCHKEPGTSIDELRDACRKQRLKEGLRDRSPVRRISREDLGFRIPDSWELACFDDVFVLVSGVTKGRVLTGKKTTEVPYLRVANVQRGQLDLRVIKSIAVPDDELVRYELRDGDILMTEGGDWDKLGRAAIWRGELPLCIHQNHVFRVRIPSANSLRARWVVAFVNSAIGRRYFEDSSKQTTNLASINMTQLRGCPLPLPPVAEQDRILAKLDELMELCNQLEARLAEGSSSKSALLETVIEQSLRGGHDTIAKDSPLDRVFTLVPSVRSGDRPEGRTRRVPIIGTIAAGVLTLAEQHNEGWLKIPTSKVNGNSFILRVKGDSMNLAEINGKRIEPGDHVVFEPQPSAPPGSIVVARLGGECVLKRLLKTPSGLVLRAESTGSYADVPVGSGVEIQGIVRDNLKSATEFDRIDSEQV